MTDIRLDLRSVVCAALVGGAEGREPAIPPAGLRDVVGLERSSLSRDASSPSRAKQQSKTLVDSGLSTCPHFFQLVCICLCFFCLPYLRARHPFMKV